MKLLKGLSSIRGTKRALIASAACTLLCGLLLFSTSIAWFTANKESNLNELYSGNLDVRLFYSKTMVDDWKEVEPGTDDIFEVKVGDESKPMLWEPGAVNVVYFKIENKGNLAAKYDFAVVIDSEVGGKNFAGTEFNLSDYIKGGVVLPSGGNELSAFQGETEKEKRDAAIVAVNNAYTDGVKTLQEIHTNSPLLNGELAGVPSDSTGTVENTAKTFALVLYMPEDAGDVTNYKTDEGNKPTLKLKVKLVATQDVGESDSFGDKYDDKAKVIMVLAGGTPADTKTNLEKAINTAASGSTILLPKAKNIDDKIDLTGTTLNANGVTVVGAEGTTLKVSTGGAAPSVNADGVTFDGVTFDYGNQTYNAIRGTVVYKNCIFNGLVNSYDNSTFINCTFNNTGDQYPAHVYAGSATFTGCTFNGSNRCVYVYTDGADATANFTNCTFTMSSVTPDKSAVMLNSRNNNETYTVTITNCTQTGGNDQGTASLDGSKYDYRGLYGFKHDPAKVIGTLTVDGTVVYQNPVN